MAVLGLLIHALTMPNLTAQINGAPPSVTSPNFNGRINLASGIPASVTSLGPNGFNGAPPFPDCCTNPFLPSEPEGTRSRGDRRDHHFRPLEGAVYAVTYPVVVDPEGNASADEEQSRDGPAIINRPNPAMPSRADDLHAEDLRADDQDKDRVEDGSVSKSDSSANSAPLEDQPRTTLVFNDGKRLEVANYAIVGSTLYYWTPGHRRKVALAELDLSATAKENDDRGIDFHLPPNSPRTPRTN